MLVKVPLSDLYEFKDQLFLNKHQVFLPVLLEIKHKDLLRMENDPKCTDEHTTGLPSVYTTGGAKKSAKPHTTTDTRAEDTEFKFKYLLQVWRKKDGKLLYERKLGRVPKSWGLHGSKFFY